VDIDGRMVGIHKAGKSVVICHGNAVAVLYLLHSD